MSRSLDMTTVAEGVEERVQVDMLKRLGCDYIQGYYFAKPIPIPDFERLAFGAALKDDPEETKLSCSASESFSACSCSHCPRPVNGRTARSPLMCLPSHPLQRRNPGNRAR